MKYYTINIDPTGVFIRADAASVIFEERVSSPSWEPWLSLVQLIDDANLGRETRNAVQDAGRAVDASGLYSPVMGAGDCGRR